MERTLAVLKGATPAQAIAKYPGTPPPESDGRTPGARRGGAATAQPVGGSTRRHDLLLARRREGSEADGMLLNYLLGN